MVSAGLPIRVRCRPALPAAHPQSSALDGQLFFTQGESLMKTRFAKTSAALALSAALAFAGCSTSWIKIALADLPVITQVALNIAGIVADAQSNLKSILVAVHVQNAALQSTIAAAVGIAVSTLASIETLIPQPAPAPNAAAAKSPGVAPAAVPPPSASQLKREFNAIFAANGFTQFQVK